ncbi:MAG: DUF418 domain-containing protein [Calditrichaeota bacterium]|nr:MAG: DUF418 domain-containing protein [Calditrichota bacterium]
MTNQELSPTSAVSKRLTPVAEKNRIESIDVLRGVAILGILAMNIYAFTMPFSAYNNPLIWGGTDAFSKFIWFFTHIIFDQKFLPIFSMLFGAGLILMFERSETGKFAGTWYRRTLWLLVIGALHGYLIWFGDILFTYAFLGLLIYPLRRKKAKTLIIFGSIWMLVALGLSSAGGFFMQKLGVEATKIETKVQAEEELSDKETAMLQQWKGMRPMAAPTAEDLKKDIDAYLGSYADAVKHRAPTVLMMQTMGLFFFGLWRMGGLMLIGMGLMKAGVFSAQKETGFYRRLLIWCYGLGLPLVAVSAWQLAAHDWSFFFFQQAGVHWNYVGSVLVALGHVSLIMLAVKGKWFTKLEKRFAAVGRMAFTNYLMQSIICTTIFYGYGLGLYGSIDRPAQMLFVVAIWIIQLYYSTWWLERFRYGPAEWFWRFLTYGKSIGFRK